MFCYLIHSFCLLVCVAMLLFDMPYGVTSCRWDTIVPKKKLETIITQFKASQQRDNWVFFAWCHITQYSVVHDVLHSAGLGGLTPINWYKSQHHTPTPAYTYTRAFEVGILGFYPSPSQCRIKLPADPRDRHNVYFCKSVTKYIKGSDGLALNPCQKPAELSQWICDNHCMPGETVLVVGVGCGGEAKGALMNGNNVVGVESDKRQWEELRPIALQWSADETARLKKASREEGINLLGHDGQGNPVVASADDSTSTDPVRSANTIPPTAIKAVNCASCGDEFKEDDEQITCESGNCKPSERYHKECGEDVEGKFHCTDCCAAARLVNEGK